MLILKSVSLNKRLQNVSCELQMGQWWFVLGPNGAGKTSLLNVMSGLEQDFTGTVNFRNQSIRELALSHTASFRCLVSQVYDTEFDLSVSELMQFFAISPAHSDITAQNLPTEIERYLQVSSLMGQNYRLLSGGEKQRVHLARNLLQIWPAVERGEALVLLDEPLQQLDVKYQLTALHLLANLAKKGNLLVMSHHDLNHAMQWGTHGILMKNAELIQSGENTHTMSPENFSKLFEQDFRLINDENSEHSYLIGAPRSL